MFDAFELNKIIGAVLFAFLVILGVGIVSDVIYDVEAPEQPGYVIEVAGETTQDEEAGPSEAEPSLPQLLAEADADAGQGVARKCTSCHTFEEGGPNRVGPNLHGVVGRAIAAVEGFAYSDAMQGQESEWTYERLSDFLEAPKSEIPGTAMAFAGIRDPGQRADLLLYLKGLSPDAPPLPEPEAEAAPEAQAETPAEAEAQMQAEAPAEAEQQAEAQAEPESEMQPEQAAEPEPEAQPQAEPEGEPEAQDQQQAAEAQPEAEEEAAAEPSEEAEGSELAQQLAEADADDGKKVARKCSSCHTFDEGGRNRIGPNLHGVVGRPIASAEGFSYSDALEEMDGNWTYEALDAYIHAPREYAPGTKMSFSGIRKEEDRADLLVYLKSISPDAPPLPQ